MELKDWGLSQLGMDIWAKKYQNNGESFEEWLDRVSGGDKDVKKLIYGLQIGISCLLLVA